MNMAKSGNGGSGGARRALAGDSHASLGDPGLPSGYSTRKHDWESVADIRGRENRYLLGRCACESGGRCDSQHLFPPKLSESHRGHSMLDLDLMQQFSERGFVAERVEPGVSGH